MTDLARLALLLTDQKARDEAPCVPVLPDELMLTRVGNIEYCDADNYDEDGSYTRSYVADRSKYDCIATLDLPALVASAARMREALQKLREALGEIEATAAATWLESDGVWSNDRIADIARAALEEKP